MRQLTKKEKSLGLIVSLLVLYILLLIPGPSQPVPESGNRQPFVWNKDEYFKELESRFLKARSMDPDSLENELQTKLDNLWRTLHRVNHNYFSPSNSAFDTLETGLFELAPLFAVRYQRVNDYIEIYNQVRMALKVQSWYWHMYEKSARDRLYRILYGGRAAVEEVMLQAPADSYPVLMTVTDEPSATPSAEILGVEIHSGDILVSRGGAPTSALIARGNDYPGNFSHVALVYIDQDTKQVSIIESHIEIGVAIADIQRYLKDKKLRIMVLRMRQSTLKAFFDDMHPHRAAKLMYDRAISEHIPYDFSMDYKDDSKLFCSEVASSAYMAYGIRLWQGISRISSPGLRSWLAAFGVRYFETQEPSDLEYDPQLSIVAEWRDPETLFQDHLDNAVIDVMLEGAEKGEKLEYDWYKLPVGRVIKAYCRIINKFGKAGPIPEGMSPEAALRNDRFSKTHKSIKKRTMELISDFEREKGYKPPYWELVRLARQAEIDTR